MLACIPIVTYLNSQGDKIAWLGMPLNNLMQLLAFPRVGSLEVEFAVPGLPVSEQQLPLVSAALCP